MLIGSNSLIIFFNFLDIFLVCAWQLFIPVITLQLFNFLNIDKIWFYFGYLENIELFSSDF